MAIKNAADTELPIPITDGGTGQITQQAALDAITDVASATTGQVLTKDGSGNAVFQSPLEGGEQLLYFTATTTDATETSLGTVSVPADKAITFTVIVSAKGPSNKHYWAKIDGGARRNTGENAALIGVPANTNDDENTPGYSATVDVNGNDLRIRVTGASAESVVWDAKILYSSDAAGEDLISSKSILVFDAVTTDATETTLATVAVPDLSNVSYWALVTAHLDNTGVDKNYWAVIEGGVRRNNGGNATLVGTRQIIEDDEGTPGYIADVDVSGTSFRIRVTGASSETVNWRCKILLVSDNTSEQLIDFLPVRDNDSWAQWRNQGDTADINVLKVDANNDTVLNALTGKSIEFKIAEAIRWSINSTGQLVGQQATSDIVLSTVDDSDNGVLRLSGGGSPAADRGARIELAGNENGSAGRIRLVAGNIAGGNIEFGVTGAIRWEIDTAGDFLPVNDNAYDIGSSSFTIGRVYTNGIQSSSSLNLTVAAAGANEVQLFTNGTKRWSINSSGDLVPNGVGIYTVGTSSAPIEELHTTLISKYLGNGDFVYQQVNATTATVNQETNSASTRYFNFTNTGAGTQVLQVNGTTVSVPFTGMHIYDKDVSEIINEGDAVKLINDKLVKCTTANDKACIGIFTSHIVSTEDLPDSPGETESVTDSMGNVYLKSVAEKTLYHIAACGDSLAHGLVGANICNEGGAVEDGDLLVTSSTPGFLMKQADDIVRASTVAQARKDVTFTGGLATGVYVYLLK